MKRILSTVVCCIVAAVSMLLCACDGNTVNISENSYVNTVKDVYTNPADYLGKTLIFEGKKATISYGGKKYNIVKRYASGCCVQGSEPGFIVVFDSEAEDKTMPEDDAWVKCTGILKKWKFSNPPDVLDEYFSYTNDQLALRVSCLSIQEMPTSGRYVLNAG